MANSGLPALFILKIPVLRLYLPCVSIRRLYRLFSRGMYFLVLNLRIIFNSLTPYRFIYLSSPSMYFLSPFSQFLSLYIYLPPSCFSQLSFLSHLSPFVPFSLSLYIYFLIDKNTVID